MAAREYFKALSKLIKKEFAFNRRSRQPPLAPFNSMISSGYTIVFYEIYAELEIMPA
jgi:CRISPR associated protein cas1